MIVVGKLIFGGCKDTDFLDEGCFMMGVCADGGHVMYHMSGWLFRDAPRLVPARLLLGLVCCLQNNGLYDPCIEYLGIHAVADSSGSVSRPLSRLY